MKLYLGNFVYQFVVIVYCIEHRAPPVDEVIHCRVTRDKQGLDKHYYLHLEKDNVRKVCFPFLFGVISLPEKVFLLAGNKKRKARSAYYTISIDPTDLSKHSNNFVAKLRYFLMYKQIENNLLFL